MANSEAYERGVLLASLASEERDLEKYHDMVDELNVILLKILQEKGLFATVSRELPKSA